MAVRPPHSARTHATSATSATPRTNSNAELKDEGDRLGGPLLLLWVTVRTASGVRPVQNERLETHLRGGLAQILHPDAIRAGRPRLRRGESRRGPRSAGSRERSPDRS